MDEVEDTYGFGSYAELFDVGPARVAKRLDLRALSRFCMSERRLARFQQQPRRTFQHVAAKFDGVGIDGGLGALGLQDGGVVWLQTAQSDSDALQRRRKQMQDVETQDGAKSAAALFVALENVVEVSPRTVQNTVKGLELLLVDDHRLELTFMPGPFAAATHRDEFLSALRTQMDAATNTKTSKEEMDAATNTKTSKEEMDAANTETLSKDEVVTEAEQISGRAAAKSEAEIDEETSSQKEQFRRLVRRYTQLDPWSEEGLAIAKQVYTGTGYQLGPTMKQIPRFAADAEYRKKTVKQLTGFLKRMNEEWIEADTHRQLHTKTKCSRNGKGLFEYTNTDTGVRIPPRIYEQRYLEYVKAHEVDPVIHLCPVPENTTKSAQNGTAEQSSSAAASNGVESVAGRASLFMTTLGVDIGSSCIVGEDFFTSGNTHAPTGPRTHNVEDTEFRATVNSARKKLWNSWGFAFARMSGSNAAQAEPRHVHSNRPVRMADGVTSPSSARKRARRRRQSLVLPTSDDLETTAAVTVPKSSHDANGMSSSGGDFQRPHAKRRRSASPKSDTAQKLKARRQSIVSTVDLPVTLTNEDEEKKKTAGKRRTTQNKPPKHSANGYARKTSALEMVGDEDADLCRLCYSERALVQMNPCNHAVCTSCWSRLSPSSGKNVKGSRRMCPWDREPVTKR